jgi:DNA/RNA endonuclease G (NUC1)
MRGDYAVPTLFNGNFDAVSQTPIAIFPPSSPATAFRTGISDAIPGWSFHNGGNSGSTWDLVDWKDISSLSEYRNQLGYNPAQPNYALKLDSGESITHNRFVVPDWGTLRFDLHVPELTTNGRVKVYIKGDAPDDKYQLLETVDGGTIDLRAADGRTAPGALPEIAYPLGYADTDTYRIGYGTQGFETFHVDVPQQLRGKTATLKFEVDSGTVFLDDVFFKSAHLMLGNPDQARFELRNPENNLTNLLIEKPQYTLSYNNSLRAPNWVSWQLNQSWIGNVPRPGTSNGYTPPNARIGIYPWRSDNALPSNFGKAEPWDYLDADDINPPAGNPNFIDPERGHMTPVDDRDRHLKDIFATFFTTNAIAQHLGVNRGIWQTLERFASEQLVAREGRELYIISGGYGFNTPLTARQGQEDRFIRVPDQVWKIIVVLNPGQSIADITPETPVITVDIPNHQSAVGTQWTDYLISVDELERRIRNAANLDGNSYSYNFLSHVPENIRNQLKQGVFRL